MGFKDVQSAFGIELPEIAGITPMALRSVLNIVALATDDATHQTFVSHTTIASRSGATKRTVGRALDVLVDLGILTKEEQYRPNGARSVDLLTFDPLVVVTTAPLVTTTPAPVVTVTGGPSHHDQAPTSPSQGSPRHRDVGNEIIPKDHSDDHPLITVEATIDEPFDEFWALWPRKVGKPNAKKAFDKALKRADASLILQAVVAYVGNPFRPETQFIPHPATWLNRDGWGDELPGPRTNGRPTPTQRVAAFAEAGARLRNERNAFASITTLNPKGLNP